MKRDATEHRTFREAVRRVGLSEKAAARDAVVHERVSELTEAEFTVIEAFASRIIPATDTPGAIEAGAAVYIDRALAGPYRAQFGHYRRGIAELERYCSATYGRSFAALDAEQQDVTLEALEAGVTGIVADGPQFFELVRGHVMEGFFCEPHYGGNRDLIGWKLVGFPGQRYGYDDPYINKVVNLPPVASDWPPANEE